MKRRVVVTGMGAVTPLGNSVKDLWDGIRNNRSGIGKISYFDTREFPVHIAGEVKNLDVNGILGRREARKMARFTQYACVAALEAVKDAGYDRIDEDNHKTSAVILGNGIGGFEVMEEAGVDLQNKGYAGIHPMVIPKVIMNEAPGNVAILTGSHGPCYGVSTACASGTDAIGQAFHYIRSGRGNIALSGGTEGAITKLALSGFAKLQALSTKYNDTPERASRPFDNDRDGFILGEGSGVLVLEELEYARKRGARIYAEVSGYGTTCDARHLTAPDPDAVNAIRVMSSALEEAGLKPEDVDYINAHGTSTPTNDPIETKAIKEVFGAHAYKLKVSSTKSMTAHMLGGAGGVEGIISTLAIRDGFIPCTLNLDNPDPECDLDYVPHVGVRAEVRHVLSNSLGFGGHNSALVFSRYEG